MKDVPRRVASFRDAWRCERAAIGYDRRALTLAIEERARGTLRFTVRVAPRASRDSVLGIHDGALKVALTAPPVDGAANAALETFLARALDLARRDVRIVAGHGSRTKAVEVVGTSADAVRALAR